MAHIRSIKLKSGSTSYKCIIKSGTTTKSKTFKTKTAARAWGKRVEADKDLIEAYGSSGASVTFEQLIKEYNESGSRKLYRCHLAFWLKQLGAKTKITDITTRDIKAGLKKRATMPAISVTGGKSKVLGKMAPASINRYRASLSSLFRFAIAEDYLTTNPVVGATFHKEDNARTRFLSDAERDALLTVCKASHWGRLHLLVIMAITTGARLGELRKLCWSDIDFDRATASMRTSKNGEPRVMPLPPVTLAELRRFRGVGKGLVFPGDRKPHQPHHFRAAWNTAREQAGLQDFKFHDLRHTCASYLAKSGASLVQIGSVLGHKSLQSTLRYSHLDISSKRVLVNNVMGEVFSNG